MVSDPFCTKTNQKPQTNKKQNNSLIFDFFKSVIFTMIFMRTMMMMAMTMILVEVCDVNVNIWSSSLIYGDLQLDYKYSQFIYGFMDMIFSLHTSGTVHELGLWVHYDLHTSRIIYITWWASYQIRKMAGCACAGNAWNVFPATNFKGKRKLAIPACITARRASRTYVP